MYANNGVCLYTPLFSLHLFHARIIIGNVSWNNEVGIIGRKSRNRINLS